MNSRSVLSDPTEPVCVKGHILVHNAKCKQTPHIPTVPPTDF